MATLHTRASARLMMAPSVILLFVWMIVPLAMTLYFSFLSYNLLTPGAHNFIGFLNYSYFLTDPAFLMAIGNTLLIVVGVLLITVIGGVLLALVLDQPFWGQGIVRLLVIAPFFVTYLIRTLAWETILSDGGPVVSILRDVHILGSDGRLLATSSAVIAGLVYNFLPFMVLPLYVSLEQIDTRLVEAAEDLYASRTRSFLKVTLPLSLPGVFAGVLLTFIPATGDFINAQLLGTPRQYMIGNVIQNKYLVIQDYPTAAALSFILMTFILIGIFIYARLLGAQNLSEAAI